MSTAVSQSGFDLDGRAFRPVARAPSGASEPQRVVRRARYAAISSAAIVLLVVVASFVLVPCSWRRSRPPGKVRQRRAAAAVVAGFSSRAHHLGSIRNSAIIAALTVT